MNHSAVRLSILAACAAALAMASPANASKSAHHGKHPRKIGHRIPAPAFSVPPVSGPAGDVCPGIARSFECKIWPPPFDDDPDRKKSGSDAGG